MFKRGLYTYQNPCTGLTAVTDKNVCMVVSVSEILEMTNF